jgi:hypothetical protein
MTHTTLQMILYACIAIIGLPVLFVGGLELAAYLKYRWKQYLQNYKRVANLPPSPFDVKGRQE